MGEDEKWSTWERQKDEGESKTARTEDGELKREPGRRQDGGQTESDRPGRRHARSITRDTPNKAPAQPRIPIRDITATLSDQDVAHAAETSFISLHLHVV